MLVSDVIRRAYTIALEDPDNPYRWSADLLLEELNDIILELGHELGLFRNNFTVDIFNGQSEYEYDESITEIQQIRTEGYAGTVIFPSSLQQLVDTGRVPTQDMINAYGTGLTVAFHNASSYGKLMLDPVPKAEETTDVVHVWTP